MFSSSNGLVGDCQDMDKNKNDKDLFRMEENRGSNKVAERLRNTREYESSPDLTPGISKMSDEDASCFFSEETLKKALAQLILCSSGRRRNGVKVTGRPEHDVCVCQTEIEETEGCILGM